MESIVFQTDEAGDIVLNDDGEKELDSEEFSEDCRLYYTAIVEYDRTVLALTRSSTDSVDQVRSDAVASRVAKETKAARGRGDYAKRRKLIAKQSRKKTKTESARHVFNDRLIRSLLQFVRQQQIISRQFVDSFREKNSLAPLAAPTPLSPLPSPLRPLLFLRPAIQVTLTMMVMKVMRTSRTK
jgi:hypothetical protein